MTITYQIENNFIIRLHVQRSLNPFADCCTTKSFGRGYINYYITHILEKLLRHSTNINHASRYESRSWREFNLRLWLNSIAKPDTVIHLQTYCGSYTTFTCPFIFDTWLKALLPCIRINFQLYHPLWHGNKVWRKFPCPDDACTPRRWLTQRHCMRRQ